MRTKIITIAAIILCIFTINNKSQAQIKVHQNGQISLQTQTDNWNFGTHIYPNGFVVFNSEREDAWHWVTMASPKHINGKCWIVSCPNGQDHASSQKDDHRFFVTGQGYIYKRGSWRMADTRLQDGREEITNSGAILDNITGVYYIPVDESESNERKGNRRVGVFAEEIEKVLPEAVSRDDRDLMYVDYEALTVVLIEAYKEQKAEIELLRKTLEEHGLLKPEE
jgi:hypothetical protein